MIDNLMGEHVDIEEMDLPDLVALRQDYLDLLSKPQYIHGPIQMVRDDLHEIEQEIAWKTRVL